MSLGSIVVRLTMNTATFDTDAGRAAKIAEKRAKEIDAAFKRAGAAIGVALAGAAVALTATIKSSINAMDDMSKSAQKVGLSTEEFSKLNYAAGLADVSMETLVGSLGKLTKSQAAALKGTGDQAKVFEALGISIKNADGSLRDSSDVLGDFADRFRDLKGSPEAMAAGFSLFGRSFQELIPLLKDGGDGIRAAGEELEALGGVLSTEAGQNAEAFNDNLTRLETAARSLAMQVASDLLPDLVSLSESFLGASTNGDKMKETASSLADSIRVLAQAAGLVATAFKLVGEGIGAAMAQGHAFMLFVKGDVREAMDLYRTAGAGYAAVVTNGLGGGPAPSAKKQTVAFAGEGAEPVGMFKMSASEAAARRDSTAMEKRLAAALGGSGTAKPKGGGGGKSEAAKEADQLTQSYERMVAQLTEQAAMVGVVSEVEKLRYELNNGEMAKLSEGQKNELLNLAQIAEFRKEDYEELQKSIKAEDDRLSAIDDATKAYEEVNLSITDQIKLLGMSADEQELWNALAWAGVEADSERGKVIAANMGKLQAQREEMSDHIELMDSIRDAGEGFFTDFVGGSKSFKDAMLDAFNSVHEKILSMIAENLMDQLFGKKGDPLGGVFGGMFGGGKASSKGDGFDWAGMIGSIFGGGKASGGMARPNTLYEVNERGFEMATVGGRDYMMTGNSPVQITPNHALRGGGGTQNNNFQFAAPTSPKTQTQIAARVGYEMRRAQRFGA